jgi:hypothetical protein
MESIRYGYKLMPKDQYGMCSDHKDHCNVLFATLHISLSYLCDVSRKFVMEYFEKVIIYNNETLQTLYTIYPDEKLTQLYQERLNNSEAWKPVSEQLRKLEYDYKYAPHNNKPSKEPIKKLEQEIHRFIEIDRDIMKRIDQRVREIQASLVLSEN